MNLKCGTAPMVPLEPALREYRYCENRIPASVTSSKRSTGKPIVKGGGLTFASFAARIAMGEGLTGR